MTFDVTLEDISGSDGEVGTETEESDEEVLSSENEEPSAGAVSDSAAQLLAIELNKNIFTRVQPITVKEV